MASLFDRLRGVAKIFSNPLGRERGARVFTDELKNPVDYSPTQIINNLKGTAFMCARIKAEEVRRIEFVATKGGREVGPNHPFFQLMGNPNPEAQITKTKLFELTDISYSFAGEAFWILELGETSNTPGRIFPARPDRMSISVDKYGEITGFVFHNDWGTRIPLNVEEVVFFRTANPADPYRGVGIVEAIIDLVQIEDYSRKFTKRFIYNNATPAGIMSLAGKAAEISKEDFEEVKRKFNRQYGGLDNRGKIAWVREAEMKWQQVGTGLENLNPEVLFRISREDIQRAFRIPDQLMGQFKESNYSNAQEARRMFRQDVVVPTMEDYVETLNITLGKIFGIDISLKNVVEEDPTKKLERYKAMLDTNTGFGSLNEVRELEGLAPIKDPMANVILRPINVAPLSSVDEPKTQDTSKGLKVIRVRTIKKKIEAIPAKIESIEKMGKIETKFPVTSKDRYHIMWKGFESIREEWVGRFNREVRRLMSEQEREIITNLHKINKRFDGQFNMEEENKKWSERLFGIYVAMAEEQGRTSNEFIGISDINVTRDIQNILKTSLERFIVNVNKSVIEDLTKVINEHFAEGKALPETTRAIQEFYTSNKWKAERIARTETTKISNVTAVEMFKQSPYVEGKQWFANPGACEFCQAIDGTIIDLSSEYKNIGTQVNGVDGGVFFVDYEDVGEPPLHPNCSCRALPWSKLFETEGRFTLSSDSFESRYPDVRQVSIPGNIAVSKEEANFIVKNGVKFLEANNPPAADVLARYDRATNTVFVYDKTSNQLKNTLFHEFGHALDEASTGKFGKFLSSTLARDAIEKDGNAIVIHRVMKDNKLTEEEATNLFNVWNKTRKDSKYMAYNTKFKEIFADGYTQFKATPEAFKRYAPNLYKFFKEIFNA